MYLRHSGTRAEIQSPAKLNLFLEVIRRRADGFHEITTFMTTVGLFDTLVFQAVPKQAADGELSLSCDWASGYKAFDSARESQSESLTGDLPSGEDNIVTAAVERLRQRAGISQGATIRLCKRIPSAAGLGGASGNAAAALLAANVVWNVGYSREQLAELGAEIGSDVPFFFARSGMAICRGRGELIEPVARTGRMHVVVVRPPLGLSTPAVYRECQPTTKHAEVDNLIERLRAGCSKIRPAMKNDLAEPAERLAPELRSIRRVFERLDCVAHQMSGSGTSYFGICRSARHAGRVASQLRSAGVGYVARAVAPA